MFTILAGLFIIFAFTSTLTALLWVACGKILHIDNLTFKKAFVTFLLIVLVSLLLVTVASLLPSAGIAGFIATLFYILTNIILMIWIIKKRFDTTVARSVGLYLVHTICSIGLALFVRTYVVQAYKIPSSAMKPTLLIGDHILVNKYIYETAKPNRGDIIVFEFPVEPEKDFIKRVVGIGGDVIEGRDKHIFLNGQPLVEQYAVQTDPTVYPKGVQTRDNFGPITVPANALFVLGDNRDQSFDSRFWGVVDMNAVGGKAFTIYWSWDKDKLEARWDRVGSKIR